MRDPSLPLAPLNLPPFACRPGLFSYMHVPSGLKQSRRPTREPTQQEIEKHTKALEDRQKQKRARLQQQAAGGRDRKRQAAMPLFKNNQSVAGWHAYLGAAAKEKKRSKGARAVLLSGAGAPRPSPLDRV